MKHFLPILLLLTCISGITNGQDLVIQNYAYETAYDLSEMTLNSSDVWLTFSPYANNLVLKFDGLSWQNYDRNSGLLLDSVNRMSKDRAGNPLFLGNGVARRKQGIWEYFPLDENYGNSILMENINGDLWLAYQAGKIKRIIFNESLPNDTIEYSISGNSYLHRIEIASPSTFYVVGNFRDLYRMNNNSSFQYDTTLSYISSMHIDSQNTIWVSSGNKLLKRNANESMFSEVLIPYEIPSPYGITDITSDKKGRLLFATGIGLFVKENDTWDKLDEQDGLLDKDIREIEVDEDANIWVLSKRGLSKILNSQPTNNLGRAYGKIFNDLNRDGLQGTGEKGLAGQFVRIMPGGSYTLTDSIGVFSFKPSNGENSVTWIPQGYWEASAGASRSFVFPFTNPPDLAIGIGLKTVHDLAVTMVGDATRPGFDTHY
jgi:hypothetical protein